MAKLLVILNMGDKTMKNFIFTFFLASFVACLGCSGNGEINGSGNSENEEENKISSLIITKTTDAIGGGECDAATASLNIASSFLLTLESGECAETANISSDQWVALKSMLESGNFIELIDDECPSSTIPYSNVEYSATYENNNTESSNFSCEQPSNLEAINNYIEELLDVYISSELNQAWDNNR